MRTAAAERAAGALRDRAEGQKDAPEVPAYRAYATQVRSIEHLSPHFSRVTLHAPELKDFHTGGLDQRIKLFLPRLDGTVPDVGFWQDPLPPMGQWYAIWRELPEDQRNPIRTYTVRAIRPAQCEIDIDFVVHGTEGPASAWVCSAELGDELIVIGPDGRSEHAGSGIEWKPGAARDLLLAGDETAAPAICAILESLPEHATGRACLEVPTSEDILSVETNSQVEICWLPRDGAPFGSRLESSVRDWGRERFQPKTAEGRSAPANREGSADTGPLPALGEDDVLWEVADSTEAAEYAWLAGEAGVITGLRRHLVKDLGLNRRQVSFMGYWKAGRAGA